MKTIRKGIALVLLAALCLGNAFAAAAAPPPQGGSDQAQKEGPVLSTSQSTTLEAKVSSGSTYSVRIPEEVSLGSLPASGDFNAPYSIDVTMRDGDTGTVHVQSEELIDLLSSNQSKTDSLPCHNRFETQDFTSSGSADGLLTIYAEDIQKAPAGSYSGTLNFYLSYTPGQTPEPPEPTPPTEPSVPVPPPSEPTTPTTPPEPQPPQPSVPPDDGSTHYTATVTMRKENSFQEPSMCNGLFHRKADIAVKDGIASLTMYVVDPVPNFPNDGTPLSRVSLHYNGRDYAAKADPSHRVMKHFDEMPGFIPSGGSYAATPVTVSLPEQALKDSLRQKLTCTAYVEAVMKTEVDFFIVLDDLTQTETPDPTVPAPPTEPTAPVPTAPSDPQPPAPLPPSDSGSSGTAPGTGSTGGSGYYTATVTMRKENAFGTYSMCNALFHRKADITVNGDTATLTIYVIDPVPKFPSDGTPLSKMTMHYDGKDYPVRISSGSKVSKSFEAQTGFIDTAGNYPATALVVQLPMQALKDSMNQKLTCTAFVNAVMKQNVNFYVALSDLTQTGSAPSNQAAPSGAGPSGAGAEEADPSGEAVTLTMGDDPKTYFESSVSMRRADDFDTVSMCNPLFYEKADIAFSGDLAELTLYVIDPVPKFADEGTPISDIAFLYDGQNYAAEVHPEQQVTKHFPTAPGFIPTEGDYTATPVTVILPKQAIEDSLQQKLMCSSYINTVMHTTQQFYVVLDDLTEAEAPTPDSDSSAAPVELPDVQQPTAPQQQGPKVVRIDTRLFPQILGYLLFTAVILGGSYALIRYRRNGKDGF